MLFRLRGPHFINGGLFDAPMTVGPFGSGAELVYELPPTFQMEGLDPEGVAAVNQVWQAFRGTDAPWTLVPPPFDPYTGAPIEAEVPVVVDIPHVQGTGVVGETLTSTMGNWNGVPSSYAYQWQRDDEVLVGAQNSSYIVASGDDGHDISCVVTASNAAGTTTAPPSNAVHIGPGGTAAAAAAQAAPPPKERK